MLNFELKCDLDLGDTGLVVSHDRLSYYGKHLCYIISKCPHGLVTKRERRTNRQAAHEAHLYIPILFFSKQPGDKKAYLSFIDCTLERFI
jgi:hypothetical protein